MDDFRYEEYDRYRKSVNTKKKKKKRRRARNIALAIVYLILLFIVVAIGAIIYFYNHYNSLTGIWESKYDFTDNIAGNIAVWMSDIEGENINVEWVKSHGDRLEVEAIFELDKDGLTTGFYKIYVDESSYKECSKKTEELMALCLEDVIMHKLSAREYKENLTQEEVTAIVQESLGCSMEEFINQNGLSVMPSYGEIAESIIGEGTYNLELKYITLVSNKGTDKKRIIIDQDKLILPEEGTVYRKKVAE